MSKFVRVLPNLAKKLKHFSEYPRNRKLTQKNYHSIQGRAIFNALDLTYQDIKTILWTAIELKELDTQCIQITDVNDRWVTLLMNRETHYLHSFRRAAHLLGINLSISTIPDWDLGGNLQDIKNYYEVVSDLLLTKSTRHALVAPIYKPIQDSNKSSLDSSNDQRCAMPMFNIGTQQCSLICVLTDLMTYQEHFGRLCGLNLLWFGQVCALINTYIPLAKTLNMNIRYSCHQMTPSSLYSTLKQDFGKSEQIREYNKEKDQDFKVDIVLIKEACPDWEQILKLYANHSTDMILLRTFPSPDRSINMPEEIEKQQKHIERAENLMYVMAAIFLRLMCDYNHHIRISLM